VHISSGDASSSTCFVPIATVGAANPEHADETGASFGYREARPVRGGAGQPGWSIETTFYRATADAGEASELTRGGRIEVGLDTAVEHFCHADLGGSPRRSLGGQTRPRPDDLPGGKKNTARPPGDAGRSVRSLQPQRGRAAMRYGSSAISLRIASLGKWSSGVHNVMTSSPRGIPSGAYDTEPASENWD